MKQPVMSGAGTSSPSASAQNWCSIAAGGDGWFTDRQYFRVIAPIDCTLSDFRVGLTVAPGAGKSRSFTIEVNGSASALSCAISDAATTGSDLADTVSVSAGDNITITTSPTNTPAATRVGWGLQVDTGAGGGFIWGGKGDATDATNTEYSSLMGHNGGWSTTENAHEQIISVPGNLQNLRVKLETAPGVGKSNTFAVRINGATSAVTLTISDAATTGADTTHTAAVAAGDRVAIINTHSSSPAASVANWGVELDPTTDGESQVFMGRTNGVSAAAANYVSGIATSGPNAASGANEWTAVAPVAFTGKNLYVNLLVAPANGGGTQEFTYNPTTDLSGSAGATSVNIQEAATTGNDTTNTTSYTAGLHTGGLKTTPAGTPASGSFRYGMTAYIAPPAGGTTWPGYIGGGFF